MGDPPRILGPGHASLPPGAQAVGDIEAIDLLAGQSVGMVNEILPAAEVIWELGAGARRISEGRLERAVGSAQT
jgi:enoyl-[acyl-carrier protein] reductase II